MDQVFILGFMITLAYCISKFIEVKYLGDVRPLKEVVRDALIVLVSSLTGAFIYFNYQTSISDFLNVVTETKVLNTATTQVFTGNPEF
jgi:hypothetical protein